MFEKGRDDDAFDVDMGDIVVVVTIVGIVDAIDDVFCIFVCGVVFDEDENVGEEVVVTDDTYKCCVGDEDDDDDEDELEDSDWDGKGFEIIKFGV